MTKARDLANGGFGLVLIKPSSVVGGTDNGKGTVTFSAASSVSLNDVFNNTYENYQVVIRLTAAGADLSGVLFRFRVSGSDNTTSNYNKIAWYAGSDNSSGLNNSINATSYSLGTMDTSTPTMQTHQLLISLPYATDYTTITNPSTTRASSGTHYTNIESVYFNATTSFTGFSIFPNTSTITGSVSVYGYNK